MYSIVVDRISQIDHTLKNSSVDNAPEYHTSTPHELDSKS